ncbi:molybdenum cofactor guanylyltransferase [Myceligenerans crystallogenes]|uniref:MobA-like NTP transferase domain-containing protein n=1 Tax=Myceligenerans crystallogenes TaxID=316335 RepID=A0ABN2N331_9MICO
MTGDAGGPAPATPAHDAIILAGGRAARLGGASKPALTAGGVPLLHRALDAAGAAGRIAVVGPDDLAGLLAAHPAAARSTLTREVPAFGGPAAGIAAGLAALRGKAGDREETTGPAARPGAPPLEGTDRWVLLLAVDVPRAAGAVGALVDAVGREACDGAHLVVDGRAQWLVGIYRAAALSGRLGAIGAGQAGASAGTAGRGASVRQLMDGLDLLEVPDPGRLSADVDTPDDAAQLGIRLPRTPRSSP